MRFIVTEINEKTDSYILRALDNLKEIIGNDDGICYVNHPLYGLDPELTPPAFTIISKTYGIIVLDLYDFSINQLSSISNDSWEFDNWDWTERQFTLEGDDKLNSIRTKLSLDRELRSLLLKDLRIGGEYYIVLTNIQEYNFKNKFHKVDSNLIFSNSLSEFFEAKRKRYEDSNLEKTYISILRALTASSVLRRQTRRIESKKTKANILSKVENELQQLDLQQIEIAEQIAPGPQRIRGLAGTGKTILLTMRAAFIHYYHPEWNVVYTFHTNSLYDQITSLIERFYKYYSNGKLPDWNKLKVLHGWGRRDKEGLYTYVCKTKNVRPKSFKDAQNSFEFKQNSELLGKCCLEVMNTGIDELFDAILIDEAQDFDKNYLLFCHQLLKSPKRLIWAYDELQSLENVNIPTAIDIFGVYDNGVALVDLDGVYPGGIEKDFVLKKTYRNPAVILMSAHIFGMGLLRKEGAIQFLPNVESWEDIGYKVEGDFKLGQKVTIKREEQFSPNLMEKHVDHKELVKIKMFSSKSAEMDYIIDEIENDIKNNGILPEDILIIGLDSPYLYKYFSYLRNKLTERNVNSFVVGENRHNSNIFHKPNTVTISTVFKAKGNEAPVVYIFNFENSEDSQGKIVQSRNMAFTCITRTKGWCTISGTYDEKSMVKSKSYIQEEMRNIILTYPNVNFIVPDMNQIQRRLDNIEYEKRRIRIKKSEISLREALKVINQNEGEKELSEDIKKSILDLSNKLKENE